MSAASEDSAARDLTALADGSPLYDADSLGEPTTRPDQLTATAKRLLDVLVATLLLALLLPLLLVIAFTIKVGDGGPVLFWQERIGRPNAIFSLVEQVVTAPPSLYREVASANAILIETSSGRLVRRTGPLEFDEVSFSLKSETSPSLPARSPGFLHPLLLNHLQDPELYLLDG